MAVFVIDGVAHRLGTGARASVLLREDPTLPFRCLAGRCGTCAVEVVSGAFGPIGPSERRHHLLRGLPLDGTVRLLCQAMVLGDVEVRRLAASPAGPVSAPT